MEFSLALQNNRVLAFSLFATRHFSEMDSFPFWIGFLHKLCGSRKQKGLWTVYFSVDDAEIRGPFENKCETKHERCDSAGSLVKNRWVKQLLHNIFAASAAIHEIKQMIASILSQINKLYHFWVSSKGLFAESSLISTPKLYKYHCVLTLL